MVEFLTRDEKAYAKAKQAYIGLLRTRPRATWLEWHDSAMEIFQSVLLRQNEAGAPVLPCEYEAAAHGYHGLRAAPVWDDHIPVPQENDFTRVAGKLLETGDLISGVASYLVVHEKIEQEQRRVSQDIARIRDAVFSPAAQSLPPAFLSVSEKIMQDLSKNFFDARATEDEVAEDFLATLSRLDEFRPLPAAAMERIKWVLKHENISDDSFALAEKIFSYGLTRPAPRPAPPHPKRKP